MSDYPDEQLPVDLVKPSQNRFLLKFEPHLPYEIKTSEDLINTIQLYFHTLEEDNTPPTFTGLAMFLGLTRHKLLNLPPENNFTPIIERAKQVVIDFAEKQLFAPKSAAGVQFWLKNNDNWIDKQDIAITKPKTMLDLITELSSDQQNIIEGESVKENNFLNYGDNSPRTNTEDQPTPVDGQTVAPQKPLQDYQ